MRISSPQSGQAALVATLIVMSTVLAVLLGSTLISFTNQRVSRNIVKSSQSYYTAEAGLEDMLLRIINPNYTYQNTESLSLGGNTADITLVDNGSDFTLSSTGDADNRIRKVAITLEKNSTGGSFFYGVQVDEGGLVMSNNSQITGNVYSNGNIIGAPGAIITGDAIVAGRIDDDPQVEWPTQGVDQFFATDTTNRDIAQSFTATESGILPQISVYLGKVGNPTSNITVRLATDNAGQPDTSSLASATIPYSIVDTNPDWITASFDTPATVANGNKYWLILDYGSNSTSNYWNWRKDATDTYAGNTGRTTNSWSSGSATWTDVGGDLAFRVWIGGTQTYIDSVNVGDASTGFGHANAFKNTTVHGSACPNQYCLIENLPEEPLPITDQEITDWQNDAAAGGTLIGDYDLTVNGSSDSLGPMKISGDMNISNNSTLTLTGTLWVQGNVNLSNNCIIQLDPGFGADSGVIVTDNVVDIANNCSFLGSGDPDSYILLVSSKDDVVDPVMNISNNSDGVVYYAPHGILAFSNNSTAKEATAYGIILENGSIIEYETGLENLNFSSGPSGGWDIPGWQEIE